LLAGATMLAAGSAGAQERLEEIIVTAQKREQNLQDIGISITALSGDEIRNLGLTTTRDLASMTPGLMVAEFGNSPTISVFAIRGVAQNDFADHNETPNAMYLDGAYVSFVGAISAQMYDVERVEVLRGPQGTLFGRNATGGLIHVISRRPTDHFDAYADLTFAEYNQIKFEGAIGGPLTKTLSARLSVATNQQDGFVKNRIGPDSGEDDQYNGRLQLLWQPNDNLDALLSVRASKVDDINPGGYDIRPAYNDFSNDGLIDYVPAGQVNPTCELFFGIPAPPGQTDCFGYTEPDSNPFTASFSKGGFTRDYEGATLTLDWSAAGASFTWLTDAQWIEKQNHEDSDGTPFDVIVPFTYQDANQLSSEFRVSGERDALRWVAGAYLLSISGDYEVGVDSALFGASVNNEYELDTDSQALFAQVEYDFASAWTLIAGLRYTWDQKDFDYRPSCTGPGCIFFEAPGSAQVLGFTGDLDESDYSAKVELDWKPSDDWLVYGSITRGMKAGGFSGPVIGSQAPEDLPFDAEVLIDYELGFKWTLPGGHTRINAGVFYYDYQDYQDYDTINIAQVIRNKDAEVYGGEIEIASTPAPGLDLQLGVSALEGTVYDITLPSGRVADREMPQAPPLSVTGLVRKEWSFSLGHLAVQLDAKYVDSRFFRSINHPVYEEDSYTVANARVSFTPPGRNWEIAVFGKNLADTEYRVWSFEDLAVNGVVNDSYGPPRWFGATLSMRWQ
jgi:iron complex outermembrane receptor protein